MAINPSSEGFLGFNPEHIIGKGLYGTVYEGTYYVKDMNVHTNSEKDMKVAIKRILKSHSLDESAVLNEIESMKTVGYHPNILRVIVTEEHADSL